MPSLVSDFIINPVLRQARRFSSGFATDEPPAPLHNRARSAGDSHSPVILEGDGEDLDRIYASTVSGTESLQHSHPAPNPRTSSLRNPVDQPVTAEPRPSYATVDTPQHRVDTPSRIDEAAVGLAWVEDGSRGTPLPEDDGNGELRKKILAIQAMDVTQALKAQLVHQLLMEGYLKSRQALPTSPTLHPGSPTSRSVPDRPDSALSGPLQTFKFWNPLGDGSEPLNLHLTEADLRPTYVPDLPPADDDAFVEQLGQLGFEDHGGPLLGCAHYRRNVKMQCATCERWYTCRFCHDAVEDHILPRKETKHMLCMLCGCPQKASDTCVRCGESAAHYFCGVCKLWNDDPNKPIYHCNDCGLCRVGQGLGKDFFHCKKCMACIKMTTNHKCIERSTDCDCPICGDYMFNSPRPVIFMQCGHSIHRHCFDEYKRTSYKCPLCNKSCANMDAQFRNWDIAILTQPMPPEYRDARAIISCNDCSAKSQTAYHWLGLKCSHCFSYNTIQLQLLNMPGQEPEPSTATSVPTSATWSPRMLTARGVRRLSDNNLPDVSALARELRRRAQALERAEGAASPSMLSRLFAPRSPAPSASPGPSSPTPADSAEDSDEDEEILDFWGRSGDDTKAASDEGGDGEEEEEEESSSSSSEGDEGDDDDDDDDEEEIALFGHR
ncbi:hypothetical protein QBC47DRAFT_290518 [Echria macrotheca]|uniref:Uncharacterized protein n=1 Tax=Echria macrotheca TaxID=438768 RepID=A0AAJ0BQ24_9PEZI|nr:hypothetical protein QBC47DRAFT_290518 [Echria macrotheca]